MRKRDPMAPPGDDPEVVVVALPDDSGAPDTLGAQWTWRIETAFTRAVLVFGERCDSEDAARAAAEEALAELL